MKGCNLFKTYQREMEIYIYHLPTSERQISPPMVGWIDPIVGCWLFSSVSPPVLASHPPPVCNSRPALPRNPAEDSVRKNVAPVGKTLPGGIGVGRSPQSLIMTMASIQMVYIFKHRRDASPLDDWDVDSTRSHLHRRIRRRSPHSPPRQED